MYKDIFKKDIQEKMRDYFLELSKDSDLRKYKKKEVIDYKIDDEFGIVLSGKVGIAVNSKKGEFKELYYLVRGEAFGESYYLENVVENQTIYCIEDSEIAFIKFYSLEKILKEDPTGYKYLYHSIYRKFQIIKAQLKNLVFQDSGANIADTLLS